MNKHHCNITVEHVYLEKCKGGDYVVYFDNSANTPIYPDVVDIMCEIMQNVCGNPGATHEAGNRCRSILNKSRKTMAALLGVRDQEVFFTSGGTESNNWAMKSGVLFRKGKHVILGASEHASVLKAAEQLKRQGIRVTLIRPDCRGIIPLSEIEKVITPETSLISVQAVNNETGAIQDIRAISELAHKKHILYHCDAVQAFGHADMPLNCADLISLSAHKFGGPQGVGCLAIRYPAILFPLLDGGGQEMGRRSGTENIAGIAGMARAAEISVQRLPEESYRLSKLRSILIQQMKQILPQIVVHGEGNTSVPNILNVQVPGIPASEFCARMNRRNICVSPGAACSARSQSVSHVLLSMGLSAEEAAESIRISTGWRNSVENAEPFLKAFSEIIREKN